MGEKMRKEVIIEGERRSKRISKMIDEGGLGAESYYNIKKDHTTEHKTEDDQKSTNKSR